MGEKTQTTEGLGFYPGYPMVTLKNLDTTLTAWFDLNNTDHVAKQYLYNEIPNHYVSIKIHRRFMRPPSLVN